MSAPRDTPPSAEEPRQPWLFFASLLVLPLVAVIVITALDVTVYLERWVSSLFE
jgi:hypothetical protein